MIACYSFSESEKMDVLALHIVNFIFSQGHMDELWGLAAHPTEPQFLTAGSDKLVQLWDSTTNAVIWREEVSVSQNFVI